MKRNKSIALLLALTFCTSAHSEDVKKGKAFEECNTPYCNKQISEKERLDKLPLRGDQVIGETIFVSDDFPSEYRTSFKPASIESVYSQPLGQTYVEGKDYSVTDRGITILPGSKIKGAPYGFTAPSLADSAKTGVKITEEFKKYQYSINYKKTESYYIKTTGFVKNLEKKYPNRKIRITFFGDAITYGTNSTHGYVNLVMSSVEKTRPGKYLYRNNSEPQINSSHAGWWVDTRLNDQSSDLIVLAFGMTDSYNIAPEKYKANIENVIKSVRAKNPATAFVLVSPIRANPSSKIHHNEYINRYTAALKDIAISNENITTVDTTSVWDGISKNKRFYDLTGNGLQTPNDYVHKVIAEAVLNSIYGI